MPDGVDPNLHLHLIPGSGSARLPADWPGVLHWTKPIAPSGRQLMATVEDALAQIARCVPFDAALVIWESAARKEALAPEALRQVRWGSRVARELADGVTGLSDSGLETLVVVPLRRWGLQVRQQVVLARRPVDVLVGDRLVLQIDGFEHHSSSAQRSSDIAHDESFGCGDIPCCGSATARSCTTGRPSNAASSVLWPPGFIWRAEARPRRGRGPSIRSLTSRRFARLLANPRSPRGPARFVMRSVATLNPMAQQRQGRTFSTTRVEAYTDGVFAIAATLLVLDLTTTAFARIDTDTEMWTAIGGDVGELHRVRRLVRAAESAVDDPPPAVPRHRARGRRPDVAQQHPAAVHRADPIHDQPRGRVLRVLRRPHAAADQLLLRRALRLPVLPLGDGARRTPAVRRCPRGRAGPVDRGGGRGRLRGRRGDPVTVHRVVGIPGFVVNQPLTAVFQRRRRARLAG